jgi:hypothetical protein
MEDAENLAAKKALMDVDAIEAMLRDAATEERTYSYSELLLLLGISFTRPKMRALCKVLDAIDARDNIPGQGWWLGRHDFVGEYESHAARKYLKEVQQLATDYWQNRK